MYVIINMCDMRIKEVSEVVHDMYERIVKS